MAENCLNIDGQSYISSSRAAELFGYTKDYVGQLARSGKIESQLIGRTWYVNEDSIRKHKLTVHYTLTKPKKPRKEEKEEDEKTSIHIDISDKEQEIPIHELLHKLETDKGEPSVAQHVHENEALPEPDDFDLFPRPVKPKSDVLTKSDFSYEPDYKVSYDEPTYTRLRPSSEVSIEPRVDSGVRLVRSQKSLEHTVKRKTDPSTLLSGIDGIFVQPTTSTSETPFKQKNKADPDPDIEEHEDESYQDTSPVIRTRNTRPSRAYPIVGALVLFAIFTTLYYLL